MKSIHFDLSKHTVLCFSKTYIQSAQQDESWPDAEVIDAAQGDGDSEGLEPIAPG